MRIQGNGKYRGGEGMMGRGKIATVGASVLLMVTVWAARAAAPGVDTKSITYLGPPMTIQSTNAYFPLSGFHKIPTFLRQSGKPELLFLGALGDWQRINIELWPLVKALGQFGRWSGVSALNSSCSPVRSGPNAGTQVCSVPTFDLSHARFSSPYLTFVSKDLLRTVKSTAVVYQKMSGSEKQLYTKYAAFRGVPQCIKEDANHNPVKNGLGQIETVACRTTKDYIQAAIDNTDTPRTLPLIAIGGYLQTSSQDVSYGDFNQTILLTPPPGQVYTYYDRMFSFDTLRQALITGKNPDPTSHLVQTVNAESNIMTAIICHATKGKPASVCRRGIIKLISKSVR